MKIKFILLTECFNQRTHQHAMPYHYPLYIILSAFLDSAAQFCSVLPFDPENLGPGRENM